MKFPRIARCLPSWKNALLAVISAILFVLAFPDFEYWFLAWFALVPLLLAIERETGPFNPPATAGGSDLFSRQGLSLRSFVLGWLFGLIFFSGTCWWLTYAPIHYAAFPWPLAYFLLFCVTAVVGIFPAVFAAITSLLLRRFGSWALLAVPFVWVATELGRFWITGNDWNAIGYSQAFNETIFSIGGVSRIGGVLFVGFWLVVFSVWTRLAITCVFVDLRLGKGSLNILEVLILLVLIGFPLLILESISSSSDAITNNGQVVAVQPNVPMAGLNYENWKQLRDRQVAMAEDVLNQNKGEVIGNKKQGPTTVILPESPMNYQWDEDPEFRQFISDFAARNNVNVLFNSAEPDAPNHKYFNSAVMIDASGREIAQYDKIYLLPFGEAVPAPLDSILPGFVGNFSYGRNYDLVPLGDARAGIMICFESHFGQLSREYVRRGADAIIEMTNDGYLGPTPVLRQHLANAVFRAIETNRPVLRVTNVGITAYITEQGQVLDATQPYTEDTRVWSVAKSDGSQTFYVRFGDWFAWLCSLVTVGLLVFGFLRRNGSAA